MQKDRAKALPFEILYYSCDYLPIFLKDGVNCRHASETLAT